MKQGPPGGSAVVPGLGCVWRCVCLGDKPPYKRAAACEGPGRSYEGRRGGSQVSAGLPSLRWLSAFSSHAAVPLHPWPAAAAPLGCLAVCVRDSLVHKLGERERGREGEREREGGRERERERERENKTVSERERERERETRQTDRQTDTHTHTERERENNTVRERERKGESLHCARTARYF